MKLKQLRMKLSFLMNMLAKLFLILAICKPAVAQVGFQPRTLPIDDGVDPALNTARACDCLNPRTKCINPINNHPDPNGTFVPTNAVQSLWMIDGLGINEPNEYDTICIEPGDYRSWGVMEIKGGSGNVDRVIMRMYDTQRPHPGADDGLTADDVTISAIHVRDAQDVHIQGLAVRTGQVTHVLYDDDTGVGDRIRMRADSRA